MITEKNAWTLSCHGEHENLSGTKKKKEIEKRKEEKGIEEKIIQERGKISKFLQYFKEKTKE